MYWSGRVLPRMEGVVERRQKVYIVDERALTGPFVMREGYGERGTKVGMKEVVVFVCIPYK